MNKYFFTTCGLITLMAAAPAFAHNQGTTTIDPASLKVVMNHTENQIAEPQQGTGNVLLAQVHVRREDRRADLRVDRREDRQMDRQADRRTDRREDRQLNRRKDRGSKHQVDTRGERGGHQKHRAHRNHRGHR